eukprot:Skav221701  [mRNA]  locus=scaffold1494:459337:464550:+ [translate_table: standard]
MASWVDPRAPSARADHSSEGCHGLACGVFGTDGFGQWEVRRWSPVSTDRGAAGGSLHEQVAARCPSWSPFCSTRRPEVDHDDPGLHQRDGFDCQQAIGCDLKEQREESQPGSTRCTRTQESSKEATQRKGKAKAACSRRRGVKPTLLQSPSGVCSRDHHEGDAAGLHDATTLFSKVVASLPRWILGTKTQFASLLACSFSLRCRGDAPATIVFPLPLADFGVFDGSGPRLSKRRWSTLLRKRLLHVVIVALNYLEGSLHHGSLHLLGRRPNQVHRAVHSRLWSLLAMCDSPSIGCIPVVPGRSGPEFIARLHELEQFAKREGFFNVESYTAGPQDFEKNSIGQAVRDDGNLPVQPYTSLNAERLKLVGEGAWDLQSFLDDSLLWLPYVEPKILQHGLDIDCSLGPVLTKEDPDECLKLARIWDRKGLLGLTRQPPHQDAYTRIFNCWKNAEHDRQIGDRRLANMTECSLQGPSKWLPGGYMLTNLHVPKGHLVYGSISDRKDFYHQCAATRARAATNVLPFSYDSELFEGSPALKDLLKAEACFSSKKREAIGDRLGQSPRSVLVGASSKVYPTFRSLLQGDHLGVEYATQGHEELLSRAGLLQDACRLRGHHPLPRHGEWEGLVIDDYFALSVAKTSVAAHESKSVAKIKHASKAYEDEKVLGSPEKDIFGSRHFKVVGAEIDSSPRALSLGRVLVGAPLQKRLAMVLLSMRVARLPVISSSLATRLTGNWTSIFMFRRCLACLFTHLYGYGQKSVNAGDEVYKLSRAAAEELVLASVLGFVAVSDLTAGYLGKVFATDASLQKGAIVSRPLCVPVAEMLWLGGDKKGAYTSLDPPFRELMRALGQDESDVELRGPPEVFAQKWKSPEFSFDFIEICAGVGSVSKELAALGHAVAPPVDLSHSSHYDITDLRLVNWLCNMIKSKRIRSMMVEPVCTTFSPAAHPAVRSYSCPLGFNRSCPKTLLGNEIAFRCLFLAWFSASFGCPTLAEQPRLSKMAWLSIWRFLIEHKGFCEAVVASCQFGSPHRKEFRMLGWGIDMKKLEKRCPGGHDHIRIEGKWTKNSAIYVPALARHFALAISRALRVAGQVAAEEINVRGLESVLCNDVLTTGSWSTELAWHWRRPAHINVLESSTFVTLLKLVLRAGGDCRFSALLDSQVAKCSHAKGRSSALALCPSLRKSAALQVCGGLYPAFNFAPTRLNTADGPSRDKEIGDMNCLSLIDYVGFDLLQMLHSLCLSRHASAWVRLTLLLAFTQPSEALLDFPSPCGLCQGLGFKGWDLHWISQLGSFGFALCASSEPWIFGFFAFVCSGIGLWILFLALASLTSTACHRASISRSVSTLICLLCLLSVPQVGTPGNLSGGFTVEVHEMQPLPPVPFCTFAEAMPIGPASAAENARAGRRAQVTLFADRVVRPQTRTRRDKLLEQFDAWLQENAQVTLEALLTAPKIQPEQVAEYLVEYGKQLFYGGKPYGRFAETINGIASRKPVFKRQLVSAWDLAFSWVADEPARHHPAMPLSVVLAFASLSFLWGWPVEGAIFLLTWTGLLRIGEVFAARRRDLILPQDGAPGTRFALLQIQQPKTRGVSAKHQAARIDPEDVVALLTAVFKKLPPNDHLWKFSPSTLRKRFSTLMQALGLPTQRGGDTTPHDLASLRPGGATYLLHRFEDADLVRRRGRWVSVRVLEIYLQEIQAVTYQARMSAQAQQRVADLARSFPEIAEKTIFLLDAAIPCTAWPMLW